MTEENGVDTELLGQSAFHKLTHAFAIRDRLRDVLAQQQAIERQYRRRVTGGSRQRSLRVGRPGGCVRSSWHSVSDRGG